MQEKTRNEAHHVRLQATSLASDLIIRRTGPEVAWHSVSIKSATSLTQIGKMMSEGGSGVLGRFGKEKHSTDCLS